MYLCIVTAFIRVFRYLIVFSVVITAPVTIVIAVALAKDFTQQQSWKRTFENSRTNCFDDDTVVY